MDGMRDGFGSCLANRSEPSYGTIKLTKQWHGHNNGWTQPRIELDCCDPAAKSDERPKPLAHEGGGGLDERVADPRHSAFDERDIGIERPCRPSKGRGRHNHGQDERKRLARTRRVDPPWHEGHPGFKMA
eukprot:scaffold193887_cov30-Tisochrysis_lutea.AAC.2